MTRVIDAVSVSQKGLEVSHPRKTSFIREERNKWEPRRAILITNDTLKKRLVFFSCCSFWQGCSVLSSLSYTLLLLSPYFLWPLFLPCCPLFLQPSACRACKPQLGLLLPAEASLDVSNPSRFLTPLDITGEIHVAEWEPKPSTISSSCWLQPGLHDTEELNPSQILDWQDINELLRVYQNLQMQFKANSLSAETDFQCTLSTHAKRKGNKNCVCCFIAANTLKIFIARVFQDWRQKYYPCWSNSKDAPVFVYWIIDGNILWMKKKTLLALFAHQLF